MPRLMIKYSHSVTGNCTWFHYSLDRNRLYDAYCVKESHNLLEDLIKAMAVTYQADKYEDNTVYRTGLGFDVREAHRRLEFI